MTTLRRHLTVALIAGFSALLAAGGGAVFWSTRNGLLRQFDATLRAKAMAVSALTEENGDQTVVEVSDALKRNFTERVGSDAFQLWDERGETVARSESLRGASLPQGPSDASRTATSATSAAPIAWNLTLPDGTQARAIGYAFRPGSTNEERDEHERSGDREAAPTRMRSLVVVVASDRRGLDDMLSTLVLALGSVGVLILGATALLVPTMLRRGLRPVDSLADKAGSIDAASLSSRFDVDALPGELRPIGESLNSLMTRLESSFEHQRRFSADLAHELRTPIAALRTIAEQALRWPESREPTTDTDTLTIATQMEGLVSRLLTLLRTERGQLLTERTALDLAAVSRACWRPFESRAAVKRLTVGIDVAPNLGLVSDPVLLRSILTNLFENAIEYSPAGQDVAISGTATSHEFSVRVTNTTANVIADDLPHLFERFWRKDAARSGTDHHGLGLSLARGFAEALGYRLTAELLPGSRLVLTLSGPIQPHTDGIRLS